MEGIYYKDGIYVLIEKDKVHDDCVYDCRRSTKAFLFGGRVSIVHHDTDDDHYQYAFFKIDGICIIEINNHYNSISLSQIVSHLNAIEANGVDAFLQNYKQSVEFLYEELKNLHQTTIEQLSEEQENSKIKNLLTELEKIRNLLLSVLIVLFNLKTCMAAGLENERVMSVVQSIMDTIA